MADPHHHPSEASPHLRKASESLLYSHSIAITLSDYPKTLSKFTQDFSPGLVASYRSIASCELS